MSAWLRCGQPSCWQVPVFQSMPLGTDGHCAMPRRSGLTACHTSMNGWPTTSTCLPTGERAMFWAIRASFDPGTRWSTSTPTRRCGPGVKSRRWSARSSTPPRYSTTTPSIRRSSPQTFSTSSASCRPSTKIRLARATRALTPCTATEPDAVRVGAAGAPARTGRVRITGLPSRRKPGPSGNVRRLPRRSSSVSVSMSRSTATTSPHQSAVTSSTTIPISVGTSTARPLRGAFQSPERTSVE